LHRYTRLRCGYQNARADAKSIALLIIALDELHAEYGEQEDREAA
jgi:hypothetical protein